MTLAELKLRVKTRVRADLATPAVNDLDDASITTWANEFTVDVIKTLGDAKHFTALVVTDSSVAFAAGSVAFPDNYQRYVSLKVDSTYNDYSGSPISLSDRHAQITEDPGLFNRMDGSNFVSTVTGRNPLAFVSDKLYIKPTSITAGKLTFIKSHPEITSSVGTSFDDVGDNLLVLFILKAYYSFIEEAGETLLAVVLKEIDNARPKK